MFRSVYRYQVYLCTTFSSVYWYICVYYVYISVCVYFAQICILRYLFRCLDLYTFIFVYTMFRAVYYKSMYTLIISVIQAYLCKLCLDLYTEIFVFTMFRSVYWHICIRMFRSVYWYNFANYVKVCTDICVNYVQSCILICLCIL